MTACYRPHQVLGIIATICVTLSPLLLAGEDSALDSTSVRSSDALVRDLLRDGIQRSATFQRLVSIIERSDGIVYVEPGRCPVSRVRACLLHWVNSVADRRYLRIVVKIDGEHRDRTLAQIGHELQHAVEVLESDARTTAALRMLFERINAGGSPPWCYETVEAQNVGDRVWYELAAQAATPPKKAR